MSEPRMMTYQEIATAKGISVGGAKSLVRRQEWPKTAGNDGSVRVQVPGDADLAPTPGAEPEPDPVHDELRRQLRQAERREARTARMLAQALRVIEKVRWS